MYRVAKRTTKKTQFHCLKCKYCKSPEVDINSEVIQLRGIMVECMAENRCMHQSFNAKDYYCILYKSANELTEAEIKEEVNKNRFRYECQQYREKIKYLPVSQRTALLREFKKNLKESLGLK